MSIDELYQYEGYEPLDGMAGIAIEEGYEEMARLLDKVESIYDRIAGIVEHDKAVRASFRVAI